MSMITFFRKVNEHFADATLEALRQVLRDKGGDQVPIVWIHDYHLMLAANNIRKVHDESLMNIFFFLANS